MIVKLGTVISEISIRNKQDEDIPVYSVTNDQGFCTGYFNKDVSSKDRTTYKIVPYGCFAYNPSRINVGSVDWQHCEDRVIVSPLYVVFKTADAFDQRYLLHYLKSDIALTLIRANASGSVRDNLKFSTLKEFPINLRSLDEQKVIADRLDKIDVLTNLYHQQLNFLDELVKSRFVEMFGTLHDNENGFDVVTIEEVCSLIKDGTHQTPQYIDNKEIGYKFLSSKDVMSQKIDWTDIKYIPEELHEKLYATIKPQRNDILMSKNGVNYGVAAVNDTDEVFDIYVSLALLRPKKLINPVFFRCVINNPETKRQFDSGIKGIGVPNLHLGEIKKTKIFLPPMDLQKEFVAFVEQVDKSKHFSELEVAA